MRVPYPISVLLLFSVIMLSCETDSPAEAILNPILTQLVPNSGEIGTELAVLFTGSNLLNASLTSLDTTLSITVVENSDVSLSTIFTISPYAIGSDLDIIVTTTGGSDTVSFNLTPPNISSLAWSTIADLPTQRCCMIVEAVNEKIYAIGGADSIGIVSLLEIYDPPSNSWSTGPDMSEAIIGATSTVIDSKIYIAGGNDINNKSLNSLYVFDPSENTWTTLTNMPTARFGSGAAAYGDRMYVFGGFIGNDTSFEIIVTDLLEMYDATQQIWTTLASIPEAAGGVSATNYGGKIYSIGGSGKQGVPSSTYYYDINNNNWSSTTEMPTDRHWNASGDIDISRREPKT